MCRLNPAALRDAQNWLEFHTRFWTERLTLTHARFAQDEARDEHERSWVSCLEKLRELCAA